MGGALKHDFSNFPYTEGGHSATKVFSPSGLVKFFKKKNSHKIIFCQDVKYRVKIRQRSTPPMPCRAQRSLHALYTLRSSIPTPYTKCWGVTLVDSVLLFFLIVGSILYSSFYYRGGRTWKWKVNLTAHFYSNGDKILWAASARRAEQTSQKKIGVFTSGAQVFGGQRSNFDP